MWIEFAYALRIVRAGEFKTHEFDVSGWIRELNEIFKCDCHATPNGLMTIL